MNTEDWVFLAGSTQDKTDLLIDKLAILKILPEDLKKLKETLILCFSQNIWFKLSTNTSVYSDVSFIFDSHSTKKPSVKHTEAASPYNENGTYLKLTALNPPTDDFIISDAYWADGLANPNIALSRSQVFLTQSWLEKKKIARYESPFIVAYLAARINPIERDNFLSKATFSGYKDHMKLHSMAKIILQRFKDEHLKLGH